MHIGVFDLFKIGIGPSSSHTVGPMIAAERFARQLADLGLARVAAVKVELFGSLGFTGQGHGTGLAVMLGLEGELPRSVDIDSAPARAAAILAGGELRLLGAHAIAFRAGEQPAAAAPRAGAHADLGRGRRPLPRARRPPPR